MVAGPVFPSQDAASDVVTGARPSTTATTVNRQVLEEWLYLRSVTLTTTLWEPRDSADGTAYVILNFLWPHPLYQVSFFATLTPSRVIEVLLAPTMPWSSRQMTEIFGLVTLELDPALGVKLLKTVANAMLGKISASITLATNAPIIAVRRSDPWPLLIAALPSRSHSARTEVRTFRQKYIHNPTEKYSPRYALLRMKTRQAQGACVCGMAKAGRRPSEPEGADANRAAGRRIPRPPPHSVRSSHTFLTPAMSLPTTSWASP